VFFAQALLVALALPTGSDPTNASPEVGGGRSGASTGPPRAANSDRPWEKQLACGPNVLYLLLRMHGRPVTFQEAEAAVVVGPKGTSLIELREAAGRLGLTTRVRSCTINNLDGCTLPMVAHFKPTFGPAGEATAAPDRSSGDVGHFVLVLEVTRDRVKFIDATLGRVEVFRRDRFPLFWSGYILEVRQGMPAWGRWLAASLATGWACLGLVVCLRVRRAGHAALARPWFATSVALVVLGSTGSASGGPPEAGGDGIWRRSGYDGINSLYLQLKALGVPVRFETLENKLRKGSDPINLLDLKRAAQDCRARMAIRSCSLKVLATLPMPVIVLMEGMRGEREFAILYQVDDRGCGIIDGSTACITEMGIDDFRRGWSGLALVPDLTRRLWARDLAIGLVAIGAYWFFRVRRTAGHRNAVSHSPGTGPQDRRVDEPSVVPQGA
jgi:hypothetical protein